MRHLISALLLTLITTNLASAFDDVGQDSRTAPGKELAERIEGLFASVTETKYQHTTEIDEKNGIVKCDCSGLMGYMLRTYYPETYLALRGEEAAWRKRPLSVTYYETFIAADEQKDGRWRRVGKMTDLVPGDIIAWRKKFLKSGSTTGHTCMVGGVPKVEDDGTVTVRLLESTGRVTDDTRPDGVSGLNVRVKKFTVDANGEPTGYFVGQRKVTARVAAGRMSIPTASETDAADVRFIGLDVAAAVVLAKDKRLDSRVIRENGKPKRATWKIVNDRLNFVVENGKIVTVVRG